MRRFPPAVFAVACVAAYLVAPLAHTSDFPTRPFNPVQLENALPGTGDWQVASPSQPRTPIELYTGKTSVTPGDAVELHVSAPAGSRYRVSVYRIGWYGGSGGRLIDCSPDCAGDKPGRSFPAPPADPANRIIRAAGWPVTDRLTVGSSWSSGYYVARAVITQGQSAGSDAAAYFVVRAHAGNRSALLVQVPVNTWQAYNPWGGASLYNFNSDGDRPATAVSFDRPSTFLWQTPLGWEVQLVRFLERAGYDVTYQADNDTDTDPTSLTAHRAVIVPGHSEYWTKGMRDAFDAALAAGTNLAFFGANNGYWQVRYADGGRTLVGWKSPDDPEPDPALKTMLFRELQPPRFECELEGVQHQGAFRHPGDPPVDYVVTSAGASDPWLAGTGLTAGTTLPDLVGREWDSIPAALPAGCVKPGLVVLLHHEGAPGNADAVRWTAASGARVFAAGSLQFSWALDDYGTRNAGHSQGADPRVQALVANVLLDLQRPQAPAAVTPEAAALMALIGTAGLTPVTRLPGQQPRASTLSGLRPARRHAPESGPRRGKPLRRNGA